jgi:hypothetical protein
LAATTILTLKMAPGCCDWHDSPPRGRWDCHEHADMQTCRDNHEISRAHPHLHAAQDEDLSLIDQPSHVLFDNLATSTKHSAARHFQPGLQPRDPSNLRNIQDWTPKYPPHRGGRASADKSTPNKGVQAKPPRWASPSSRCLPRSRFTRTDPDPVAIIAGLCYTSCRSSPIVLSTILCTAPNKRAKFDNKAHATYGPKL